MFNTRQFYVTSPHFNKEAHKVTSNPDQTARYSKAKKRFFTSITIARVGIYQNVIENLFCERVLAIVEFV